LPVKKNKKSSRLREDFFYGLDENIFGADEVGGLIDENGWGWMKYGVIDEIKGQ
jgi:hypothetical protein